jgi:hypothetical protein
VNTAKIAPSLMIVVGILIISRGDHRPISKGTLSQVCRSGAAATLL